MATTYNNQQTYVLTQAQFNNLVNNNGLVQGARYEVIDNASAVVKDYVDEKLGDIDSILQTLNNGTGV